jgi:uncharacterized membrane protein YdfJ with MMPL/SSD domain
MWSISLPFKEHYGSQNYSNDHFGHIGVFVVNHKYVIVGIIAMLAALAIVIALQHAAMSKPSTALPAKSGTSSAVSNQNEKQNSTTVESNSVESNITADQTQTPDARVKTEVKVNNQPVPVPDNGSVQKTITSDNGTTKVDIHVNSNTQGSSQTHSSTTFKLDSKSKSEAVVEDSD